MLTQQRFERTLAWASTGSARSSTTRAARPARRLAGVACRRSRCCASATGSTPWLHQKYGDIYTVRLVPKGRPLVFFTRPEHAKEIFAGDPEVFHAGKGNAILGPVMGEHSPAAPGRRRRTSGPASC